jgi:putative membrane protein
MMWDYGGWWMVFAGLMMIVFWGGIIALIVWLVRRFSTGNWGAGQIEKHDPLYFAKERYAKGEITKEQFEQIKRDLSN